MTKLIHDIDVLDVRGDPASTEVTAVDFDSRRVGPGSLFCCVPGEHTDGHLHAAHAVIGGAASLLCDRFLELDVTQVRVTPGEVRPAMAAVASAFHDHPARAMTHGGGHRDQREDDGDPAGARRSWPMPGSRAG